MIESHPLFHLQPQMMMIKTLDFLVNLTGKWLWLGMGVNFLREWHWEALSVTRYLHGLKGSLQLFGKRKIEFMNLFLVLLNLDGSTIYVSFRLLSFHLFCSKNVLCSLNGVMFCLIIIEGLDSFWFLKESKSFLSYYFNTYFKNIKKVHYIYIYLIFSLIIKNLASTVIKHNEYIIIYIQVIDPNNLDW